MWSKFKNSRFFAFIKNKYFIATFLFLVWICFFDKNSLLDWTNALFNLSERRAERSFYLRRIDSTDRQMRELKSNKDSIEKFARERYFFQKEGEDVFIVGGENRPKP